MVVLPLDGNVLLPMVSLVEFFVEDCVFPVVGSEKGNGIIGFLQVFSLLCPLDVVFGWCPLCPLSALLLPALSIILAVVSSRYLSFHAYPSKLTSCCFWRHVWLFGYGCHGCWRPAPAWWFTAPARQASHSLVFGFFSAPRLPLWVLFLAPPFF